MRLHQPELCQKQKAQSKSVQGKFHYMAMGQNLRYLFGDDYPPKIVYFKGFRPIFVLKNIT